MLIRLMADGDGSSNGAARVAPRQADAPQCLICQPVPPPSAQNQRRIREVELGAAFKLIHQDGVDALAEFQQQQLPP
jgi:hypothetical protein